MGNDDRQDDRDRGRPNSGELGGDYARDDGSEDLGGDYARDPMPQGLGGDYARDTRTDRSVKRHAEDVEEDSFSGHNRLRVDRALDDVHTGKASK